MENVSTIEEILTVSDTAILLKICKVKAYNLFHLKGCPYFKIGRSLRITKTDLLIFIKENLSNKSN